MWCCLLCWVVKNFYRDCVRAVYLYFVKYVGSQVLFGIYADACSVGGSVPSDRVAVLVCVVCQVVVWECDYVGLVAKKLEVL